MKDVVPSFNTSTFCACSTIIIIITSHRAPQPPTNPPTGHQMSLHALAQIDQKCQLWAKFGRFWAKNPFFYWRNQNFVTHITENPPRHLVQIGFWLDIGQNVQKMTIFGPK